MEQCFEVMGSSQDNGRLNRKVYCWTEINMTRTKNWHCRLKKDLEDRSCAQSLDGTIGMRTVVFRGL